MSKGRISYPLVANGGSTRRQSVAEQMAEMLALRELDRTRGLDHLESERLGILIYREQQRARYRPERIRRLRAELELLETLEMAERGAAAEGCASGAPVDLAPASDGTWTTTERQAA